MAYKRKGTPAYYVGEVIRSNADVGGGDICDVIEVINTAGEIDIGGGRTQWCDCDEHSIVIKSRRDGQIYGFIVDNKSQMWELITPVEERLWNL